MTHTHKANKYSSHLTSTHSNPQVIQTRSLWGTSPLSLAIPKKVHTSYLPKVNETLWDFGSGQKCKLIPNARRAVQRAPKVSPLTICLAIHGNHSYLLANIQHTPSLLAPAIHPRLSTLARSHVRLPLHIRGTLHFVLAPLVAHS